MSLNNFDTTFSALLPSKRSSPIVDTRESFEYQILSDAVSPVDESELKFCQDNEEKEAKKKEIRSRRRQSAYAHHTLKLLERLPLVSPHKSNLKHSLTDRPTSIFHKSLSPRPVTAKATFGRCAVKLESSLDKFPPPILSCIPPELSLSRRPQSSRQDTHKNYKLLHVGSCTGACPHRHINIAEGSPSNSHFLSKTHFDKDDLKICASRSYIRPQSSTSINSIAVPLLRPPSVSGSPERFDEATKDYDEKILSQVGKEQKTQSEAFTPTVFENRFAQTLETSPPSRERFISSSRGRISFRLTQNKTYQRSFDPPQQSVNLPSPPHHLDANDHMLAPTFTLENITPGSSELATPILARALYFRSPRAIRDIPILFKKGLGTTEFTLQDSDSVDYADLELKVVAATEKHLRSQEETNLKLMEGSAVQRAVDILTNDTQAHEIFVPQMEPCRVLSFDPVRRMYLIEWLGDAAKTRKVVSPLTIQFSHETEDQYAARVLEAFRCRNESEALDRFCWYANHAEDISQAVGPLSDKMLTRIVRRSGLQFPAIHAALLERALDDIVVSYREGCRFAALRKRIEKHSSREALAPILHFGPRHLYMLKTDIVDQSLHGGVHPDLRLMHTTVSGACGIGRARMASLQRYLSHELFIVHRSLYFTIYEAVNAWSKCTGIQNLVITELFLINPPTSLEKYEELQRKRNNDVSSILRKEWLDSVRRAVQNGLEQVMDVNTEKNNSCGRPTRATRLLKRINLSLAGQLQGVVQDTVRAMREFFASLRPDKETIEAVRDEGCRDGERKSNKFLLRVASLGRQRVTSPSFFRPDSSSELNNFNEDFSVDISTANSTALVQGIIPLLKLRIDVEDSNDAFSVASSKNLIDQVANVSDIAIPVPVKKHKNMVFVPPLSAVEDVMYNIFAATFETADSIPALTPFAYFPPKSKNIEMLTAHARSLRGSDELVIRCEEEMRAMLAENFAGPRCLLRLYQGFQYLLDIEDTGAYVSEFESAHGGSPPLENYEYVCDVLTEHIDLIQTRSLSEVVFPLFCIDCKPIKQLLSLKAKSLIGAILSTLIRKTDLRIDAVDARYADLLARLETDPRNPVELQETILLVDGAPTQLQSIGDEFASITEAVHLLSKYGYMPSQVSFEKYWGTYDWPRKVNTVLSNSNHRIQGFRAQFLNELLEQTTEITDEISAAVRTMDNLADESNIDNTDKVMSVVKKLEATLLSLQERADRFNEYEIVFGRRPTKFVALKELRSQFAPYSTMWRIASESRAIDSWLDVPLESLDPQEIQIAFGAWSRDSNKTLRAMQGQVSYDVAKRLKGRLEDFRPIIPLIDALAKPSFLSRKKHVAKVAELAGLSSAKAFNLHTKTARDLVKLNLLDRVSALVELSNNAERETKLESQMGLMKEAWQKIFFTVAPFYDTALLQSTDSIRDLLDDQLQKTQTMLASPYAAAIMSELQPWYAKLQLMSTTLDAWMAFQHNFHYLDPIFTHSRDIVKALPAEAALFADIRTHWIELMESVSRASHVAVRLSDARLRPMFTDGNDGFQRIIRELFRYLDRKRAIFPRFFFLSNDDLIEVLSESANPRLVQPHLRKCFEGIDSLLFDIKAESKSLAECDVADESVPVDLLVSGMQSNAKETIMFSTCIDVAGAYDLVVERWLGAVESAMFQAVNEQLLEGIEDYARRRDRAHWALSWPGQVVITVSQMVWTLEVESAIVKNQLKELERRVRLQLDDLAVLVREELAPVHLLTLQALIVLDIHARDVTTMLCKEGIDSLEAFSWISQLRYYLDEFEVEGLIPEKFASISSKGSEGNATDNDVEEKTNSEVDSFTKPTRKFQQITVSQIVATLLYGNEYLGNSGRLVITPLTDRCYRCLTAACHLNCGGAPEGPAGTGKTETTKDLAKAIARMCVVFNCSDTIKPHDFEKLLRGLAATGSWGCFDEFNRIESQVLSIIAQQVLSIQLAVTQKRDLFLFEGQEANLKQGCSIFITMNPGYAGRSELPDNLKALFRPVAMMVPDYALIAENSLYSCGFLQATALSKKIVAAYRLASQQLSTQSHYDFGMRAVKAVLLSAEGLRKRDPEEDELLVVMRAIRDVNLPKFLENDAVLFTGIIHDLFGKTELSDPSYGALREGFTLTSRERNLELTPFFERKMLQLYEMVKVRHGVMIVGFSLSGKSAALHTLAQSLTWANAKDSSYAQVKTHVMNPKSITMAQLYGYNDASGAEWHDGILSSIFRKCSLEHDPMKWNWLVLDGPVDAVWIENMNTVLDDNKKLCLQNGDITRMSPGMTMVFITQDLAVASPATVSRCGMVYVEPKNLGWKPLVHAWLNSLADFDKNVFGPDTTAATTFEHILNAVLPVLLDHIRTAVFVLPINGQMAVAHLLQLLGALTCEMLLAHSREMEIRADEFTAPSAVADFREAQREKIIASGEPLIRHYCESIFVFSLINGIGHLLCNVGSARAAFEKWIYSGFFSGEQKTTYTLSHPLPVAVEKVPETALACEGASPPFSSLFMCKLVIPQTLDTHVQWVEWLSTVPEVPLEDELDIPYHDLTVPSTQLVMQDYFLRLFLRAGKPFLIAGSTGTGKTQLVKNALRAFETTKRYVTTLIQFTANTTSGSLQQGVERLLERRSGRLYGIPHGKTMVLFIDDLSMPQRDLYGTQGPIELLRQFLQYKGWYGTTKQDFGWKTITDIVIIAATQPPDAARPAITNRLIRHCFISHMPPQDKITLQHMFQRLLDHILHQRDVEPSLTTARDGLVSFAVDLFCKVSASMLPTPKKSHYTYNLRDLCRIFQGVAQGLYPPECRSEGALVTLVVHECVRELSDRLADETDLCLFSELLDASLRTHMKHTIVDLLGGASINTLLYSSVLTNDGEQNYVRIPSDMQEARAVIENAISVHNAMSSSTNWIDALIFDFVLRHVARLCRVIQQPGGSVLLVGLGGSGRRTVCRLAALMLGYGVAKMTPSRNYTRDSGREDIGVALRATGERGIPTLFIIVDSDVTDESLLEDICSVLNTGQLPGLFTPDVEEQIVHTLLPLFRSQSTGDVTHEELMDFFVHRTRANLHFTLCFSPVGNRMRTLLRRFPPLVNCTSIDWAFPWARTDLFTVGLGRLAPFVRTETETQEVENTVESDVAPDTSDKSPQESVSPLKDLENNSSASSSADLPVQPQEASVVDAPINKAIDSSKYDAKLTSGQKTEPKLAPALLEPITDIAVQMYEDVAERAHEGRRTSAEPINFEPTPTVFLDMLDAFLHFFKEGTLQCVNVRERYTRGLSAMRETEMQVAMMQAQLEHNKPLLEAKAAEVKTLIAEIEESNAKADKERTAVAAEESIANAIAEEASAVRTDCERELSAVMPAMNAATQAVSQIDKKQLVEIKSLISPPERMLRVIQALCIVLGVQPVTTRNTETYKMDADYWTPTKTKVMANVEQFRELLITYDKENMDKEIFEKKLLPYTQDPLFRPESVGDISQALVGIVQWILAMHTYYNVEKVVRPKKEKLAKAEKEYSIAMTDLTEKKARLNEIDQKLEELRLGLESSVSTQRQFAAEQMETGHKLDRAIRLLKGLASEKGRYEGEVATLEKALETVIGDALLSAAFTTTLGPFTHQVRNELIRQWSELLRTKEILFREDYNFMNVHATELQFLQWHAKGLPVDEYSGNSAAIVSVALKYPYLVDPQRQAAPWLKTTMASADHPLIVARQSDSDFQQVLTSCITAGNILVVEDCDENSTFDPCLTSVLRRQLVEVDGHKAIVVGDMTLAYCESFRMFFLSRSARPTFTPELFIRVTVVGFFVTHEGLTSQVAQHIIAGEARGQVKRQSQVVEATNEDRERLQRIEDSILALVSSGDDLLATDSACETLDFSRMTAVAIGQRLQAAGRFQKTFSSILDSFLPAAREIAALFFILLSLRNINPAYEFSVEFFLLQLRKAMAPLSAPAQSGEAVCGSGASGVRALRESAENINNADEDEFEVSPEARLARAEEIRLRFNYELYTAVTQSLYSRDHLVYSFLFSLCVTHEDPRAVLFFTTGGADVPLTRAYPACPENIPKDCWAGLVRAADQLTHCKALESFPFDIISSGANVISQFVSRACSVEDATERLQRRISSRKSLITHPHPVEKSLENVDVDNAPSLDEVLPVLIGGGWDKRLSQIEKLVVIRCLRPDYCADAVRYYVYDRQGMRYLTPSLADPRGALEEHAGAPHIPFLFVLSSGADPLSMIRNLAEARGIDDAHVVTVSLGSGMAARAEAVLHAGVQRGDWVVLQNCHLYKDWMPDLERLIEGYSFSADVRATVNLDFRLWLTLIPSPDIPAALLQRGVKLVVEPPAGLKANLASSYSQPPLAEPDFLDGSLDPVLMRKLAFALCFLHAVVQERRAYGSIGWSVPYAFNTADLSISLRQIRLFVDRSAERRSESATAGLCAPVDDFMHWLDTPEELAEFVSFQSLQYLVGECNYGGRVTDAYDRRLLLELVEKFITPGVASSGYFLDAPQGGAFPMPSAPGGDLSFYIKFIESFPAVPSPAVLGLNANSALTRSELESAELISSVTKTLPAASPRTGCGDSEDSTISDIAHRTLERIRGPFDIDLIEQKHPITPDTNFGLIVLVQELRRFNILLVKVRESLSALKLALEGKIVLTTELASVLRDILCSETPAIWLSISYPSLKSFSSYILDLERRLLMLDEWVRCDGEPSPVCWIGGLFFPHSFITGVLQNHCHRRVGMTIDMFTWDSIVLPPEKEISECAAKGWYYNGIFLEGAGWDTIHKCLHEAPPGVLLDPLPILHIFPVTLNQDPNEEIESEIEDETPVRKPSFSNRLVSEWHAFEENEGLEVPPESADVELSRRMSVTRHRSSMQNIDVNDVCEQLVNRETSTPRRRSTARRKSSLSKHAYKKEAGQLSPLRGLEDRYNCPLYRTQARGAARVTAGDNLIISVELPMPRETSAAHWTTRGTALISSTKD